MIWQFQNRPFASLLALLAFNVLLLSLQVRNPEGEILLRSWGLFLVTPVVEGVHVTVGGVSDFVQKYALLRAAEAENERLRRENDRLQLEMAQLRTLAGLLPRSRDYEDLKRLYQFKTLTASVINMSAPFYGERVTISAGLSRDVKKDAAVIGSQGVVGRVLAASPFTSEVELITNKGAGAGALIEGSRLQGVIRGDGSELLRLDYIPNVETVEEGALVLTSGADQIYPKGVVIGLVVRSEKGSMIYREIEVRPAVDFARIEEVLVVLRDPPDDSGSGEASDGSAPFVERPR